MENPNLKWMRTGWELEVPQKMDWKPLFLASMKNRDLIPGFYYSLPLPSTGTLHSPLLRGLQGTESCLAWDQCSEAAENTKRELGLNPPTKFAWWWFQYVSMVFFYIQPNLYFISIFLLTGAFYAGNEWGNDPLANYQFHHPSNPQQPIQQPYVLDAPVSHEPLWTYIWVYKLKYFTNLNSSAIWGWFPLLTSKSIFNDIFL